VQKRGRSKSGAFARLLVLYFNSRNGGERGYQAILVGGNNKTGVWGQSPQPPEAKGGSGTEPPTLWRFYSFLYKKYAFLGIFRS